MYLQFVKNLQISRNISKAELARFAGVSRAAVTKWFDRPDRDGWVNVESTTLRHLAQGLGVAPGELLKPASDMDLMKTRFLWDGLCPGMADFIRQLAEHRLPALARLVQVLGLPDAKRIAGRPVITRFHDYKKYIKPVRRKQLEVLWELYALPG